MSILGFSDPVSSMSHLFVGVPLFFCLTIVLLLRGKGHLGRQVSLAIYGIANIVLFSMSGVYHLLEPGTAGRDVLQRLDHAAIFVMIAGTFTPTHWILFQGWQRWGPLLVVWAVAILGVTLKSVYFTDLSEAWGLTLYLGMGWLGAVSGYFIWFKYGFSLFRIVIWGGLAYTFGALLDYLRWPTVIPGVLGHHELFHLAVLIGACWFAYFIYLIASHPMPIKARAVGVV